MAIDYENFITDMLADRQFLEENAALCGESEIMKCVFVHLGGREEGILVVPENGPCVKWAAHMAVTKRNALFGSRNGAMGLRI